MNEPKTTTLEVFEQLKENGFNHTFIMHEGKLKCVETEELYAPTQTKLSGTYRFEGISDPDDSRIIYALETFDGTRGSLSDAYGVYASQELADFLEGIEDQRQGSHIMHDVPARKTIEIKVS